jgi:hypothetical protein
MTNTLAEDLIAAKALIANPEQWCKGIDHSGRSQCAMYAISEVARPDLSGFRYCDMSEAILAALPRNVKLPEFGHRIVAFNDADQTSHADVMALFDRAIKRAQRKAEGSAS